MAKVIQFPRRPIAVEVYDHLHRERRNQAIELRRLRALEKIVIEQPALWWFDDHGYPITTEDYRLD